MQLKHFLIRKSSSRSSSSQKTQEGKNKLDPIRAPNCGLSLSLTRQLRNRLGSDLEAYSTRVVNALNFSLPVCLLKETTHPLPRYSLTFIAQAGLGLAMEPRLTSNSWHPCLSFSSTRIVGVPCHTRRVFIFISVVVIKHEFSVKSSIV